MQRQGHQQKDVDVVVLGAGILGVCIAYWISNLYDCNILLVDKEMVPGAHASTRNTGVLHRPFYLHPRKKRTFARAAAISYPLWKELAERAALPWLPVGTLSVATTDSQEASLKSYLAWGEENGMGKEEMSLLDKGEARRAEPELRCRAAFLSATDVSVDFGSFTRHVAQLAEEEGVRFDGGHAVEGVEELGDEVGVAFRNGDHPRIFGGLLINAAGGGALRIAHASGLAGGYAALNFRGDYWIVEEPFASRVRKNIYTPPRNPEFPFLDPHFVVRPGGLKQIGPNAALVSGPYSYRGFGAADVGELLSPPLAPKLALMASRDFLSMVAKEWRSSLSKKAMCGRVNRFLPGLKSEMLAKRGVSGVRSNLVGEGGFLPEAEILQGPRSVHILNYNSPGATGAPAFSAMLVRKMRDAGRFDGFHPKPGRPGNGWDFERSSDFD